MEAAQMGQPAETTFSHVKEGDTGFKSDGLRDFFLYRDLGIAKATGGKVVATLVRANKPPEEGTGWHRHIADFHIVIMLKGWARFMYEDQLTLVEAGDCVHQRPGIVHYLFDYSKDMEYLEVAGPANFGTVEVPAPCEVPAVTPWTSSRTSPTRSKFESGRNHPLYALVTPHRLGYRAATPVTMDERHGVAARGGGTGG